MEASISASTPPVDSPVALNVYVSPTTQIERPWPARTRPAATPRSLSIIVSSCAPVGLLYGRYAEWNEGHIPETW
jgi:hypothetical protein